jgi:hypothetical protein
MQASSGNEMFARLLGVRVNNNDFLVQNVKYSFCPLIVPKMLQALSDLPEMLKWDVELFSQSTQHAQRNKVSKRVHPTEIFLPVHGGQAGRKEAGAIPMSQLMLAQSCKARNVFFAERLNDVGHGFHSPEQITLDPHNIGQLLKLSKKGKLHRLQDVTSSKGAHQPDEHLSLAGMVPSQV